MSMSITNFIPSEIIEAILLRLPPQSLARFRWVSKEWNSVISNPKFIKTHTHQLLLQPTNKKLLAFSKTTSFLYSIKLTIDNNNNTITPTAKEITFPMQWEYILGSCNGLILARGLNKSMFLMNPTTLDLFKLPVNPVVYNSDMHYRFGYDSSTDDYKVLYISAISYNNSVSIYSLRNNSWRKLPITPPDVNRWGGCALVNGNCHWLAKYPESIIAFSFVDQLFSEIKPPDSILDRDLRWIDAAVVEIGGRLGVYLCLQSGDYELWVMQEYGHSKSWTRVFSQKDYMRPLCLLQGSDRDIVFKNHAGFGVFNIDEGRRRDIRIVGGPSRFIVEGSFVESIESTKRIIKTP